MITQHSYQLPACVAA